MAPQARCGRTDEHGAHVYIIAGDASGFTDKRAWCAGNVNVIEAQPACNRMGRDWAGRLMSCMLPAGHRGSHIGFLGGRIDPKRA